MTTKTMFSESRLRSFKAQALANGRRPALNGIELSIALQVEQAVLQSPEVQAWKKDAERYQFCRSQTSPAEIHIHGVELGLAGESLDEAMDEEMKEWGS